MASLGGPGAKNVSTNGLIFSTLEMALQLRHALISASADVQKSYSWVEKCVSALKALVDKLKACSGVGGIG